MAKTTGISLFKTCDHARDKWPKCRGAGHGWIVVNRVAKRPGWPTACGGTGRLWIGLRTYAKRIGQPTMGLDTKAEAEACAQLVIAEHAAWTLADTMAGRRAHAAPSAPTGANQAAPEGPPRTFAAAAKSFIDRRASSLSTKGAENERLIYGVIGRQRPEAHRAPFGEWLAASITSADIERVYRMATARAAQTQQGNSARLKYRRALREVMKEAQRLWKIPTPITDETSLPIAVDGGPSTCATRKKRIPYKFEEQAITVALTLGDTGRRLAALILGLVECVCRPGELLAVKVSDVYLGTEVAGVYQLDGFVMLTATEAGARKTKKARPVPISARLRPVLIELLLDIDGEPLPPHAYVFGNAKGERLQTSNYDPQWHKVVLLTHGITPQYGKGTQQSHLTPECRAKLREINLQLRDCRHEGAHRWHEGRWVVEKKKTIFQPPIDLRDIASMMGHSDLTQMKVYLGNEQDDAIKAWRRSMGISTPLQPAREVAVQVLPFRRALPQAEARELRAAAARRRSRRSATGAR